MPVRSEDDETAGDTPQWDDKNSDAEAGFGDDDELYLEQDQIFDGTVEDDFDEDSFGEEETFDDENL